MAESATRPPAMDPPHITEFASDRYFEKLNQLKTQQQQHADAASQPHHEPRFSDNLTTLDHNSSPFILPLREYRAPNEISKPADQKRDKGRFFSIRQKVSLRHSKPSYTEPETTAISQTRASTETARKRCVPLVTNQASFTVFNNASNSPPLDQLFLALPSELQIQIISALPLHDVLSLREASKSWHTLITLNETPIVRYHLDHHIPAYALRLYPVSESGGYTFHYLCGLWHRLHVAAKLSSLMCEWITKEIFLRHTEAQRLAFAGQHERMRRRLIPLLFTVFHFFETYRKLHLKHMTENPGYPLQQNPYTKNPIEVEIMNMYDNRTLLRVHEVFPLIISSFCRRLRPPTYVGRVERSLRGYIREKPSEEVHVAILCLGGLRQVERLWEIKGYNSRRGAVDVWFNSLTKEGANEPLTKQRRGLMNFGRKKSTTGGDNDTHSHHAHEGIFRRSSASSAYSNHLGSDENSWIFNTSLSAGAPMSPLSHDQARDILKDLPVLQHIWVVTAEAMVLERKVVGRAQDIKRNQHVMLDLIREDGIDEEDEWWYGRANPDSVRPPPGTADDDIE
ncbi:hypothetical protein S7711_02380 [Stachybotrys chartarum IBT 7711]|uniref:F-box domain-containing protein n=1 Tax=Stachybotrys chartarum (strain CBS 109288 / IBT 7711) TaxID=1280523 RepID=A0A084AQ81_STACB|nr:hypothetical protein S7711_02380 [Stachybotrys chartarum IBT 7711]KFA47658.1 hypothetical protein S40293_07686 [Stachybotrys chartarum IBT 40293]